MKTVQHKNTEKNKMKKHYIKLTILTMIIATLLLNTNILLAHQTFNEIVEEPSLTYDKSTIINIDGDVSPNEAENRIHWNPHTTGLTNASLWNITFNNETQITLKTKTGEDGHVAAGAWWATSFRSKTKHPLYVSKPINLKTSFRVNIASINYEAGGEWLRIALACAVQRSDGSVVYTEMDFWDSPNTLRHPSGNIEFGGNIVYRGGDVVEYKIDQAAVGEWIFYSLDLARYIDMAWSIKPGDLLESVYVVIETMGSAVNVDVRVDDLWITQFG
jgi:hypothetical protein